MSKIFLVKKDPAKEGQDNWITMNGAEFMAFMRTPEGASRKNNFGCIDSCGDGDSTIIIECGEEKARNLRVEKDRRIYLQRQLEKSRFTIFSYSTTYSEDGEISGEEMLKDESSEDVRQGNIVRTEPKADEALEESLKGLPKVDL